LKVNDFLSFFDKTKGAKKQECGRLERPPAFLFDIEKGEGKMVWLPSFRLLILSYRRYGQKSMLCEKASQILYKI